MGRKIINSISPPSFSAFLCGILSGTRTTARSLLKSCPSANFVTVQQSFSAWRDKHGWSANYEFPLHFSCRLSNGRPANLDFLQPLVRICVCGLFCRRRRLRVAWHDVARHGRYGYGSGWAVLFHESSCAQLGLLESLESYLYDASSIIALVPRLFHSSCSLFPVCDLPDHPVFYDISHFYNRTPKYRPFLARFLRCPLACHFEITGMSSNVKLTFIVCSQVN